MGYLVAHGSEKSLSKPAIKQTSKVLNRKCKCYKIGNLVTIAVFDQLEPPKFHLAIAKKKATIKIDLWIKEFVGLKKRKTAF